MNSNWFELVMKAAGRNIPPLEAVFSLPLMGGV